MKFLTQKIEIQEGIPLSTPRIKIVFKYFCKKIKAKAKRTKTKTKKISTAILDKCTPYTDDQCVYLDYKNDPIGENIVIDNTYNNNDNDNKGIPSCGFPHMFVNNSYIVDEPLKASLEIEHSILLPETPADEFSNLEINATFIGIATLFRNEMMAIIESKFPHLEDLVTDNNYNHVIDPVQIGSAPFGCLSELGSSAEFTKISTNQTLVNEIDDSYIGTPITLKTSKIKRFKTKFKGKLHKVKNNLEDRTTDDTHSISTGNNDNTPIGSALLGTSDDGSFTKQSFDSPDDKSFCEQLDDSEDDDDDDDDYSEQSFSSMYVHNNDCRDDISSFQSIHDDYITPALLENVSHDNNVEPATRVTSPKPSKRERLSMFKNKLKQKSKAKISKAHNKLSQAKSKLRFHKKDSSLDSSKHPADESK